MVTYFRCWWQNYFVGDFFRYVADYLSLLNWSSTSLIGQQHLKLVSNTLTVSNIRHQHRCNQMLQHNQMWKKPFVRKKTNVQFFKFSQKIIERHPKSPIGSIFVIFCFFIRTNRIPNWILIAPFSFPLSVTPRISNLNNLMNFFWGSRKIVKFYRCTRIRAN